MRLSLVLAAFASFSAAHAQQSRFSFGAIAGVPASSGAPQDYHDESPRYSVGATFECAFGDHLAAEVDGIYRRIGGSIARGIFFFAPDPFAPGQQASGTPGAYLLQRTRANSVEVPILGKYYFAREGSPGRFFVATGYSFLRSYVSTTTGFLAINPAFVAGSAMIGTPGTPTETGAVFGGGWARRAGRLTIAPSFRYTHWGARIDGASRNQIDVLLALRL